MKAYSPGFFDNLLIIFLESLLILGEVKATVIFFMAQLGSPSNSWAFAVLQTKDGAYLLMIHLYFLSKHHRSLRSATFDVQRKVMMFQPRTSGSPW
jgi:hypothetical protein